ncbi:hypothetical protein JCM11251_005216 [Rhodosporidiobolus azoricus]
MAARKTPLPTQKENATLVQQGWKRQIEGQGALFLLFLTPYLQLTLLLQVPLKGTRDIALETFAAICSHLDLVTVFLLLQLNKRFWRFLRNPSLDWIWEMARDTSELPEMEDCFDSVYDYANLFLGGCKGCGKATSIVDCIL